MSKLLKAKNVFKINDKNKVNGLMLLEAIEDEAIATAFFDPQYRGVLDKLQYGNEGKSRGKARCNLPQMTERDMIDFIEEIDRVLKPSGHLFLWVDKFHLCEGIDWWLYQTDLSVVDLITWDKDKIGMGYRTRRKSEYLLVLQKAPTKAKGCFSDHSIPDVWKEKVIKTHPHSKPKELQKRLIAATTKADEYVLDPAAGGYSVLEACKELKINFIGADISTE